MQPKIYLPKDHRIDINQIDSDALYVLQRLRQAGFIAYLVGGGVRDLLLRQKPKDYDISTSALPEQVKQIFHRQCLLIGRRFRLAHIRFGHKIIEVSTFRTGENDSDLIVHDNEWGTPEQDVLRRDFTINGLFYDSENESVIDYVNGWVDIQRHILRTIGDPEVRFKQDPVRMLRLLKFRARFGFEIDQESHQALLKCKHEITKSSPARVLEEIYKMLESGASAPFFMLLTESEILNLLFPPLSNFILGPHGQEIFKYLAAADRTQKEMVKVPLDRAVLTSTLLYPIMEVEIQNQFLSKGIMPHIGEIMMITSAVIKAVLNNSFSHFPRKISTTAAFILTTQYRLTPLSGKRHPRIKLLKSHEFELALQFLKIRAQVNEKELESYLFWKNLVRQHSRHTDHRHHHPPPQKLSKENH